MIFSVGRGSVLVDVTYLRVNVILYHDRRKIPWVDVMYKSGMREVCGGCSYAVRPSL